MNFLTMNGSYQTYLMYRPAGADSIWVTLEMLPWRAGGDASRSGTQWYLVNGSAFPSANSPSPQGQPSTTLPEWNGCFTKQPWYIVR